MHDPAKAVRVSTRMAQTETDRIAQLAKRQGVAYPEMVAEVIRAGLITYNEEQSIDARTQSPT